MAQVSLAEQGQQDQQGQQHILDSDTGQYWWKRLAGAFRHGGIAAAHKAFEGCWKVAYEAGRQSALQEVREKLINEMSAMRDAQREPGGKI